MGAIRRDFGLDYPQGEIPFFYYKKPVYKKPDTGASKRKLSVLNFFAPKN